MSQGRKTPQKTWDRFLACLGENYGSVKLAAQNAGIDPRSVYNHMRKSPAFKRKMEEIFDSMVVPIAQDQLHSLSLKGEFRAIRFILVNKAPKRWNAESLLKKELELELAKDIKELKDGRTKEVGNKYPTLLSLIATAAYEQAIYVGSKDIPDQFVINLKDKKAYYKRYERQREEWLKNNPQERHKYEG
ncbi:MAG: hypothetical protein WCW36_01760 [Candidatus Paceibacterota bacterium]